MTVSQLQELNSGYTLWAKIPAKVTVHPTRRDAELVYSMLGRSFHHSVKVVTIFVNWIHELNTLVQTWS